MTEATRDRFADVQKVLQELANNDTLIEMEIERLDIRFHASGEVGFRAFLPREQEPWVGYYTEEELSS